MRQPRTQPALECGWIRNTVDGQDGLEPQPALTSKGFARQPNLQHCVLHTVFELSQEGWRKFHSEAEASDLLAHLWM